MTRGRFIRDGLSRPPFRTRSALVRGRTFAVPLTLLRVRSPGVSSYDAAGSDATSAPESAADYLATVAAALRRQGLVVETRVGVGEPDMVIADAAHELGTGVVVLATHGRGGLPRVILGSTALKTVQQSPLPLVLVRPLRTRIVTKPAGSTPAGARSTHGELEC